MVHEDVRGTLALLSSKMKYLSVSPAALLLSLLADRKAWYRFIYECVHPFSPPLRLATVYSSSAMYECYG